MSNYIDARLSTLHTTMGEHLDALLDLDTGLREVLTAASYTDLGRTLDHALDLNAGLRAIVPSPAPVTSLPAPSDTATSDRETVSGHVAAWLMSQDTATRLVLRGHPAINAIAFVFVLVGSRTHIGDLMADLDLARSFRGLVGARARVQVLASALARIGDLIRDLDCARARTNGLVGDLAADLAAGLDRALDLAHDLDRTLAHDLDHTRGRTRALNRALTHVLDLDRVLVRVLDLAHVLVRVHIRIHDRSPVPDHALDRDLERALERALERDRALQLDRDLGFDRAQALNRGLDRARHDFTTADLRGIDLGRVPLDGLRWSAQTRWPSETWQTQARQDSTEIEPGVYEIHGGMTHIPTDTLAM